MCFYVQIIQAEHLNLILNERGAWKGHMPDIRFCQQNQRGCGIIYCRTRELTEEVATVLSQVGVPTAAYHAGLFSCLYTLVANIF